MRPTAATTTHTVDFRPRPAPPADVAPTPRVPRVARLLALAHRIDAMIAAGEIVDLADAARACGVTRARMTQIANLLLLAPAIQEAILAMEITTGRDPVTERGLRAVVAEPDWEAQISMWRTLTEGR